MGWYGESDELCPNCGKENAVTQFHNDMYGPLFLACPDCGLKLHCNSVSYTVSNSYIDKDIIGKDPEDLENLDENVDREKDEKVILNETYTASHQG